MTRSTAIFLSLAFLLLAIFVFQREETATPLTRTRLLMGTVVEIRIDVPDAARFEESVSQAFAAMDAIEKLMSPHLPESEISRISTATEPVKLSAETMEVLRLANRISTRSGGAFDASLGRLINLWGFAEGDPQLPTESAIKQALSGTGPGSFKLAENKLEKVPTHLAIDLGGVAKGYAIDRAVSILSAAGVKHASVNAGGDMRLIGDRAGVPWRIGIQHPRLDGEILAKIDIANRAVVTSGDYERFFETDGIRYHHILDPRSGYPARLCQAVTVVAEQAAEADALATAVFVLGPERGMELLTSLQEVEGLIVAADGSVTVTPGLKGLIKWP